MTGDYILWFKPAGAVHWLQLDAGNLDWCRKRHEFRRDLGFSGIFLTLRNGQEPEEFVEPARLCNDC